MRGKKKKQSLESAKSEKFLDHSTTSVGGPLDASVESNVVASDTETRNESSEKISAAAVKKIRSWENKFFG